MTDYGKSNSYGLPSPIYGVGNLKPQIIIYSHTHEDHYDPSRMPDSARYVLTDFDTLTIGDLTIRPVRVAETSVSVNDNSAFIFTYKGLTLVHSGDTQANIMNIANQTNRDYLKRIFPEKIDLLLMPIEGVSQFIQQAEQFIDFIKPKRVIPMHYWSKQYESDFLAYLESQNQAAGKNYQIDRQLGAKFTVSTSDTSTIPVSVISLNPLPFSEFTTPCIRFNQLKLNDSSGNNNGRADAGETVKLAVTLTNLWIDALDVTATLRTADPDVQPGNMTSNFGAITRNQHQSNDHNPFTFSVRTTAIVHYSTFYLDISAQNSYATIDSFSVIIGTPRLLLIDDDNGKSYETSYTKSMIPEVWEVMAKGCPAVQLLQSYESVIWSTGDDCETSLTAAEQSVIAGFLDQGGKILLCGQNIGSDLAGSGSSSDSTFLADYLHAMFVADSTNATVATGITGDPVSGGMLMSLAKTPAGEGKKTAPDVINIISPAEIIFKYVPGNAIAGLRHENPSTGSRLVYLPFGIEKIIGPKQTTAADLIEKTLTWLMGATSVDRKSSQIGMPEIFSLDQNYPNPFNSSTTIQFHLPRASHLSLKIFDVTGRLVATLADNQNWQAGSHSINWEERDYQGKGICSGVYLVALETKDFKQTRKMLYLK
ncbi:MAG: MBL fold metallo-hydrolase [bacterium]|nr:MBL fold metallo-hydrolase [bacterium]